MRLGINIDHVATLRQARKTHYPDPILAAQLAELAGCDLITCHLREDRRHIVDKDLYRLKKSIATELNLEMSINTNIVKIALDVKPDKVTFVPEKREELTTEGGLNLRKLAKKLQKLCKEFKKNDIRVSLFIEPDSSLISLSKNIGADEIEIHTGSYANCKGKLQQIELDKVIETANIASSEGLFVAAGHGLNYYNTAKIASIKTISELNIGHSIISRAVFTGMQESVRTMLAIIHNR